MATASGSADIRVLKKSTVAADEAVSLAGSSQTTPEGYERRKDVS